MGFRFGIEDHRRDLLRAIDRGTKNALQAMGIAGVEIVQSGLYTRYGAPVVDSGNLVESIAYKTKSGRGQLQIGTGVEYAPYVHDGTIKMAARPFLSDSLGDETSLQALQEVAQEQYAKALE